MNTHLGTPLSNEEVDLLEARMDTEFENTPLPGTNIYQTRWAICTVGEDIHRFAILKAAQDWYKPENRQVQSRLIARVDRYKYELRHALDLCEKKLSHTEITSSGKIDEKSYEVAWRLFQAADQFAYATRVFSSYRSGFSQFYRDTNSGVIRLNRTGRNIAYYVLEYMAQADSSEINPLWIVVPPFAGPAVEVPEDNSVWEWSDTIHAIVRRAKIKNSNIKYQIVTKIGRELLKQFQQETSLLPDNWCLPWGNGSEARAFFQALQTRCFYHLLSIHFGAARAHLFGCGIGQICLRIDKRNLIDDIVRIGDLSPKTVSSFIDALIFGMGTTSPDPALQPFIPVAPDQYAIPCTLILSSNWQRNLLSLHARVSSRTFDASSSVFEKKMTTKLMDRLPTPIYSRANVTISGEAQTEEIDLVLVDSESETILICELRWMIQPGDAREVLNRMSVCYEKVEQAERKLTFSKSHISLLTNILDLDPTKNWKLNAAVVIEGFGGIPSPRPNETPIVPVEVFVRIFGLISDLDKAHAFLCSTLWLPRLGLDFERPVEETDLWGVKFAIGGLTHGHQSYLRESLPQYTREAADLSPEQLRSMPW
jgi:hypothetical protein